MSYDLYFRARSGGTITHERFNDYFSGRAHYEIKEVQAWYSNNSTGVYFSFDFGERGESSEEGSDPSLFPIGFNLNYFRPHTFGLEAEPEVHAFVDNFDLTVVDPQNSGMGEGDYSTEGFLTGWNAGNEFGYRAVLSQSPAMNVTTLPSARIEAYWRWNFGIETRLQEIGVDVFVPTIYYLNSDGSLRTGIVWGDAIPILLPHVDLVLAPRDRLRPKKLFGTSKQDIVLFSWSELEPIVKQFPKQAGDPVSYLLSYEKTPADIEKLFRSRQPPPQLPKAIASDEVLDQELVARFRS